MVRLRGQGIQGVDWPAPGRGSAAVPVMVYQPGLAVTLNGKPWQFDAAGASPIPAEFANHDDAYQQASLWRPGRGDAARRWLLGTLAVGVLGLGLARHADPRRATQWMLVTAMGLSVGAIVFVPDDRPELARPAAGRPGWEWLFVAGRADERVELPFEADIRFLPASLDQLKEADPVVRCDATGRPTAISCRVPAGGRAVFLRRITP